MSRVMGGACVVWCALLMMGCAVGQEYARPIVSVPDAWHEAAVEGVGDGTADLRAWWDAFEDPVLSELIERAGGNNRDVRTAYWRIMEARAARGIAAGEDRPRLDASGSFTRSEASENGQMAVLGSSNLYNVGVDATWEIDVFGRIQRNIESSDASWEASVEDYRDVLVALYAEVALTYVEARTLEARIASARENVQTQERAVELAEARFDAEIVPELDVAQAKRNLATTQSIVPRLEQDRIAAMSRLAVLLGEHPGALREVMAKGEGIPAPPERVAVGLPVELLRQRPDVRAAERRVAAQHAQIGVAEADLYPRFSLSGAFALEATTFSSVFNGESGVWSWGPAVRWNVFDGNRIRSNVAVQDARTRQLVYRYEQSVLAALGEVESAMAAYKQEQIRSAALGRAVEAAQRSVELVDALYRSGLTDFQNVLDAQRAEFELEDQLLESTGLVTQDLVLLYRSLGGGWRAKPVDAPVAP